MPWPRRRGAVARTDGAFRKAAPLALGLGLGLGLGFGSGTVGATARVSELTDLQGPYIDQGPIAWRAGLDFRWRRREAAIASELDCLQHEVVGGPSLCPAGSRIGLADDLRATTSAALLDVDLRLAFYAALEVRLRLPFVLSEDTRLDFAPGVDPRNSLTAPYNAPRCSRRRSPRAAAASPIRWSASGARCSRGCATRRIRTSASASSSASRWHPRVRPAALRSAAAPGC